MKNLKDVFNTIGKSVKFDSRMVKRIQSYVNNFINKTPDSVHFFGDTLIGVYSVKFLKEDRNEWFDEVLDLDERTLKTEILDLDSIESKFIVSSDALNLSYLWVLHRIATSKQLSQKEKDITTMRTIAMMHYKFISSIHTHSFPYKADKAVALATYAELSKKFSLKTAGSWYKLVEQRSEDILGKDSIHYRTFMDFSDDSKIVYMVNDIQGRIREVIKKLLEVFYSVRERDARITSTSNTINLEGVLHVRDRHNEYSRLKDYIKDIASSAPDFIKDDLVGIILKAVHTAPERTLREALEYIPNNYKVGSRVGLEELLNGITVYTFTYIQGNDIDLGDIATVLSKLKSMYMSSRNTDTKLELIKERATLMVDDAVSSKDTSIKSAVRTAVLLYIVLRTLSIDHYR